MTTPVSTKWQKHALHEECFYLNQKHQANPPEPNSPDVYIVSRPAMTIFTRYSCNNITTTLIQISRLFILAFSPKLTNR